jgi:membrane-bound serine protease (ClpP class)
MRLINKYTFWFAALVLLPVSALAQTVYHVKVHTESGMIDPGIAAFIERVTGDAAMEKPDAIVLDIDTFGGRVDAAVVIRDALLETDIFTIAFVNKRAISAGALISLSCDKIVMTRGASIGAATAVDAQGNKGSDKVISYFRAEMRATAERTGRDPKIAEAMVDDDIYIAGLSEEAGQPATLTTEQALNWRVADETAETLYDVLRIYDLEGAEIKEIETNWAEEVVRLLTHPVVSSILMAMAMFGLVAEVRTPGWGLGGTLALVALALFFGSNYIVKLAEWDELLIFAVGLGLLLVEVVVIPGFGLVGLAGILLMVAALLMAQIGQLELRHFDIDAIAAAMLSFAAGTVIAFFASALLLRNLSKIAAFRRLVLESETKSSEGYVSASIEHDKEWVGQEGVTLSYLRPVGVALFDGKRLDVIAEGEFIAAQTPIKIVEAYGSRLVVRAQ